VCDCNVDWCVKLTIVLAFRYSLFSHSFSEEFIAGKHGLLHF